MQAGTVLDNGAIVIESGVRPNGSTVVLAVRPARPGSTFAADPFVTWQADETATYWGHYFEDLDEARENLQERIGAPQNRAV